MPVNNEQQEFDGLVQALAKVLVDRLNEKELVKILRSYSIEPLDGGINRLEQVLATVAVPDYEPHIKYLRQVQNLRSALAAHSKDKRFDKISAEVGLPEKRFQQVFRELLEAGSALMDYLRASVQDGSFESKVDEHKDTSPEP